MKEKILSTTDFTKFDKIIAHIDMDAFFAAIEQRDNPFYKNKPVIVGGEIGSRGVVSTASYEARKFGIHSAMPIKLAHKLCPEGIFLTPHFRKYEEASTIIKKIFTSFSPVIESLSLDECFLDLTGTEKIFGSPLNIIEQIKKLIFEKTKLTCSAGIAPNKFLAKIASDLKKPDGLVVVEPHKIGEFLFPLPIGKMWGVGKVAEKRFRQLNIHTIGDLEKLEVEFLSRNFGSLGEHLYLLAKGIDERKVEERQSIKSLSREDTFKEDINDAEILKKILRHLSDSVSGSLRKKNLKSSTVVLTARYPDFQRISLRKRLSEETNDPKTIAEAGYELLFKTEYANRKLRLIGIGVIFSDGQKDKPKQLGLFHKDNNKDKKNQRLYEAIDKLKSKFGDRILVRSEELEE